jgi:hypothetical protein
VKLTVQFPPDWFSFYESAEKRFSACGNAIHFRIPPPLEALIFSSISEGPDRSNPEIVSKALSLLDYLVNIRVSAFRPTPPLPHSREIKEQLYETPK